MHAVEQLFAELASVEPYPEGIVPVPKRISGTAFFPGGTGLWNPIGATDLGLWPHRGVMILGHDFDSKRGYDIACKRGTEVKTSATWRALLKLLEAVALPCELCFFTNAFMGLRAGNKATGLYAGTRDPAFVARCRALFVRQVELQAPRMIITLGMGTPAFLAPLAHELAHWTDCDTIVALDRVGALVDNVRFGTAPSCSIVALTHPSYRALNVGRRRFEGLAGDAAEREMLHRAMAQSAVS